MLKIKQIKELLENIGVKPSKSYGQNFLVDNNVLKKIIDKSKLKKSEQVLEVGPGLGFLTELLSPQAKSVVVVEKDKRLAQYLEERELANVKIEKGDVLRFDINKIKGKYRVIANLPYSISSRFIRQFLETSNAPESMVLMLQWEVIERMLAKPGEMNMLALSVQYYSDPKVLFKVSKNSFWPSPRVDSGVILLDNIQKNAHMIDSLGLFAFMKSGFSSKRKQLKNNLAKYGQETIEDGLVALGLAADTRAQTLSLDQWQKLYRGATK
jgi:16S rRNA (adenine1518-N6/adenine1519-N6)-dimethyltransferase